MIIKLNGKEHDISDGTTLSAFVESLGLKPQGIAIAIDYEVIPKDQWKETVLSDKLELILIQAVSGG
jgi:sulfur carrier protein